MAHGKPRRRRDRLSGRTDRKLLMMRVDRSATKTDAAEQRDPLHQMDTETDAQFSLMACEHPGQCSCESDYPNWSPGPQ